MIFLFPDGEAEDDAELSSEDLGEDLESMEDVEDTMSVIENCVDSLQISNKSELNKLMQDLYNEALTVETV